MGKRQWEDKWEDIFTHQLNKKREEKNSSQRKTELNSVWKKMREKWVNPLATLTHQFGGLIDEQQTTVLAFDQELKKETKLSKKIKWKKIQCQKAACYKVEWKKRLCMMNEKTIE